ncbi:MAG: hypothetical protein ACO1SV_12280 [Fimbriimonas sp.]
MSKTPRRFRVIDPAAAKVGNRALGGQIVTEDKLGDRVKALLDSGAIEEIPAKAPETRSGDQP